MDSTTKAPRHQAAFIIIVQSANVICMKVALVIMPTWGVNHPPISLGYLTAYLRSKDIEVKAFDFNIDLYSHLASDERVIWQESYEECWIDEDKFRQVEPLYKRFEGRWLEILTDYDPQVIGFSNYCSNRITTVLFARAIRVSKSPAKIVVGGPNCSPFIDADNYLDEDVFDAIVYGEGEQSLHELVNAFAKGEQPPGSPGIIFKREDGSIFKGEPRSLIPDIDAIPFPDYDDLPLDRYRYPDNLPFLGSRGCVGLCVYCAENTFVWKRYRQRSAENIYDEFMYHRSKYGIYKFEFVDSFLNGNAKQLNRLAELIEQDGLDWYWWGNARFSPAMSYDIFAKMSKAGCQALDFGLESASPNVLRDMRKGIKLDIVRRNIRDAHKAGIRVQLNFIIGFPTESWADFLMSVAFIIRERLNIDEIKIMGICAVVVGTPLRLQADKFGLVIPEENASHYWHTRKIANTYPRRMIRLYIMSLVISILRLPQEYNRPNLSELVSQLRLYYQTMDMSLKARVCLLLSRALSRLGL